MPVYLVKTDIEKKRTVLKRWKNQVWIPEDVLKIQARTKKEAIRIYNETLRKLDEEEKKKKGSTVSQSAQVKTETVDLDRSIQGTK